jgi:tetratricopeptide (TPR) repeat protein
MNRATFVVFLLLFAAPLMASELNASIASLENDWANAYYQPDEASQKQAYPKLLEQAVVLLKRYPNAAEPKIWLATILATNAAFEPPLTALSNLKNAKDLLEAAIKINPKALDGSAYVTLGTLYYMLPGWPVSFGDDEMAEEYLKSSLEINPDGIDANYFYADFLFRQDRTAEAEVFFQKAVEAPVRKMQVYADTQLQNEAKLALNHAQQRKSNAEKNRFQALFTTASIGSK